MIWAILATDWTRNQIIDYLGIPRATFYRWIRDIRIRKYFKDFEEANLNRLSAIVQKRTWERIKKIDSLRRDPNPKSIEEPAAEEEAEEDFEEAPFLRKPSLSIEDLPKEIREDLPQKLKPEFEGKVNIITPDMLELDWSEVKRRKVEYDRKRQKEIGTELKADEKKWNKEMANSINR